MNQFHFAGQLLRSFLRFETKKSYLSFFRWIKYKIIQRFYAFLKINIDKYLSDVKYKKVNLKIVFILKNDLFIN